MKKWNYFDGIYVSILIFSYTYRLRNMANNNIKYIPRDNPWNI